MPATTDANIETLREPFEQRCRRAGQVAEQLGAEQLIASDPSTVRWLTGRSLEIQYGPLYPFSAGTLVVLGLDGSGTIICPADGIENGPPIKGLEIRPYEAYSLNSLQPFENAARLIDPRSIIAIEAHACAARLVKGSKWVDAGQGLRSLRIIKDEIELQILRQAATIVEAGQRAFRQIVRPGITEIDAFSEVHMAMQTAAGERTPVFADFMSGERVAKIGLPPTDRTIQKGDLALCDLLVRFNGYWADSCTTLAVGEVDDFAHHLHRASLNALDVGIRAIEPGMSAGKLDEIIRHELAQAGYSYPIHSGHGLGVSFHEEPRIVPQATLLIEPGMVIALEPGAYPGKIGARVERMLEITETGALEMTSYDLSL